MKGNALTFVKSNHMPITTLVEPSRSIPGAPYARAIPAIYRKQGYIGILNLGEEDVIIPKGTEIGLALPMKAGQRALDPSPEDEPAIKSGCCCGGRQAAGGGGRWRAVVVACGGGGYEWWLHSSDGGGGIGRGGTSTARGAVC